jgi:O-methyltransferase
LAERYLDLLRETLTFSLWGAQDGVIWEPIRPAQRLVSRVLQGRGLDLVGHATLEQREMGHDWPRLAHTMIGSRRLKALQEAVEQAIAEDVPGDLIETGVWRGGACIMMRGVLAAHGVRDRTVWVADSFAGLPTPDAARYPADAGDSHYTWSALAVSDADVRENFRRYGLLDEQVRFLVGWFRDTLPTAPIERLAVLRLDGDMYGSTTEALSALYPRLSDGGFCIVDDYGAVEGCRRAIEDYRGAHQINDPMIKIDEMGVYWRKNVEGSRR